MVSFPNCKINLGLNILSKRQDGYHNIESVFLPITFKDILEVVKSDQFQFTATGLPINGDPSSNLCQKAYHLLKEKYETVKPVNIHLHKLIPMGAGLGGGSADGAFTLRILSELFQLTISKDELHELALILGSDCPFFLLNKPAIGNGRGELLEEISIDLSAYEIVLAYSDLQISTAATFAGIAPSIPEITLKEKIKSPVEAWRSLIKNDFENTVFAKFPQLETTKNWFYENGAAYASLTGTGSVVYGIYRKGDFEKLSVPPPFPYRLTNFLTT